MFISGAVKTGICDSKMIHVQFMSANNSNTNCVITILFHSVKAHFQNIFITYLHVCRVAKDLTESLISRHKLIHPHLESHCFQIHMHAYTHVNYFSATINIPATFCTKCILWLALFSWVPVFVD